MTMNKAANGGELPLYVDLYEVLIFSTHYVATENRKITKLQRCYFHSFYISNSYMFY